MILLYSLVLTIFMVPLKSKRLSTENCDKVSEELSAQGVTFEEKFQLNTFNTDDLLCIHQSSEGPVSSCCNQATEKLLLEVATSEYEQVFANEMSVARDAIKNIEALLFNISSRTMAELVRRLEAVSSMTYHSPETANQRLTLIRRMGSLLEGSLRSDNSISSLHRSLRHLVDQFVDSFISSNAESVSSIMRPWSGQRTRRHWRQGYRTWSMTTKSSDDTESNDNSDLEKALGFFVAAINVTRRILKALNVTLTIVGHITKCRECSLPEECAVNVMRMNHCSYCAGETLSRPCFSVCLQVVSGCMWRLQGLSNEWKTLYGLVETFFSKRRNQDHLLRGGIGLYDTVRGLIARLKVDQINDLNQGSLSTDDLRSNIMNLAAHFAYESRQIKTFWENLAVSMCTRSTWFSSLSHNLHCWNGSALTSPQWHKCPFCHDKRTTLASVPKIVTKSLKDMAIISSSILALNSTKLSQSTRKYAINSSIDGDDYYFKHSELSVKQEGSVKKKNSKDKKSDWKELDRNSFIIFDDVDVSSSAEEGSGKRIIGDVNNVGGLVTNRIPSRTTSSCASTIKDDLLLILWHCIVISIIIGAT